MTTGSPRQLWLLPVLLITVIATALGALVARSLYDDPPPQTPVAVEPTPSSQVPESKQPGSSKVQGTADATTHPLYNTLQPLLQKYFDAINTKDYASWASTVTDDRQTTQPEKTWQSDYKSTRDGSIVVYRIDVGGDGSARVLLHFVSTQDVEDSPPELKATCIEWEVVWPFTKERGEWRLSASAAGSSPQHEAC